MKVQVIKNQNSISHKAYFKQNKEFKMLWAIRPEKMENIRYKLQNFKHNLPSHELEIIDSSVLYNEVEGNKYIYTIINNTTKKAKDVLIDLTSAKNLFETVIDDLTEKNDKNNYFFHEDTANIMDYHTITKP